MMKCLFSKSLNHIISSSRFWLNLQQDEAGPRVSSSSSSSSSVSLSVVLCLLGPSPGLEYSPITAPPSRGKKRSATTQSCRPWTEAEYLHRYGGDIQPRACPTKVVTINPDISVTSVLAPVTTRKAKAKLTSSSP